MEQTIEIVGEKRGKLGERRLLKINTYRIIDGTSYKGVTDLVSREAQDFAGGSHSGKRPRAKLC